MDAKRGQGAAEWVGADDTGRQAAQLSADARTLTLDSPGMRKSPRLQLHLKLHTADGTSIERVMYLTVPVLDQR